MSEEKKLLQNVLVKIVRSGAVDRVMYLDNVPEEFFYELRYPMVCVGKGQEQHYEPDLKKPKVMTLYEELSLSQTGDKGIVFDLDNEQASQRFLTLVRYIRSMTPATQMPIEPVANSVDPSDPRSNTIPMNTIPRAVLPVLSPASNDAGAAKSASSLDIDAIVKAAVEKALKEQAETYEQEKLLEISEKEKIKNPLLKGSQK